MIKMNLLEQESQLLYGCIYCARVDLQRKKLFRE